MTNLWKEVTVEEARKTKRKRDAEIKAKERAEQFAEWQQRRDARRSKWTFFVMAVFALAVIWGLRA